MANRAESTTDSPTASMGIDEATQHMVDRLMRIGYVVGDIEAAARDGGEAMREYAVDALRPAELTDADAVDWDAVADSFDRRLFDPVCS